MMEYDPYDDLPEMPEELLLPAYLKQGSGTGKQGLRSGIGVEGLHCGVPPFKKMR